MIDATEIRRTAADILRQRGWIQNEYVADADRATECEVCLVEAIGQAAGLPPLTLSRDSLRKTAGNDPEYSDRYKAAMKVIDKVAAELGRPKFTAITPLVAMLDWNDDTARTVDQVLAALEGRAA